MPKADATELAPKKIGYTLRHGHAVPEGSLFSINSFASLSRIERALPKSIKQKTPFSLVKLPSGGLGLKNAKIARPLLPGAPL